MKAATSSQSRHNVLIYGIMIVVLLGLSLPYSLWLENLKSQKDLGEATLGDVDTGSFMLKLAFLGGARGIAANVLWSRAIELQKAQEWDRLKVTVDRITQLQPHFLAIWTFQSWNLAYNVSVEWDAPEDKYVWIKEGIKFCEKGVENNRKSPDLIWDTASYYYHKIGFADEAIILRRLFRDDDDDAFKTDPIDHAIRNDNFQIARSWFAKAVELVDSGQTRLATELEAQVSYVDPPHQRKGRPGDLTFRSMPAHAQTRYAVALEKESTVGIPATFGEVASNEFAKALHEWVEFGRFKYMSHNEIERNGKLERDPIYLDDSTIPERFARLNDNQKFWTRRWADQTNYPYWKDRCLAEMDPQGVHARRLFYEGTKAFKAADFPIAGQKFKEGLALWDDLLKRHPAYRNDDLNKKDTGLIVYRYTLALRNLNEPIPDTLPFKDLLEAASQDHSPDPFDALEIKHASSRE